MLDLNPVLKFLKETPWGQWPVVNRPVLIPRLNSGNFRIFEPSEWNFNLNSSNYRASKIIYNDIKLDPISWELNLINPLFNFCLTVWVGGHPWANLWPRSKDAHKDSTSFDINVVTVGDRGNMVLNKKLGKNGNYGD